MIFLQEEHCWDICLFNSEVLAVGIEVRLIIPFSGSLFLSSALLTLYWRISYPLNYLNYYTSMIPTLLQINSTSVCTTVLHTVHVYT